VPDLTDIPDLGSGLLSVAIRSAVIYAFLVVALRLGGKREVGQLTTPDLVVLLIVSNAVQNAMVGENTTLWGGLVAAATLLGLDKALKALSERSSRAKAVLEGEPRLLVRDGRLLDRAMREETVDLDDLEMAIREHGLAKIEDVGLAVLERDGTISIVPAQADPQHHARRVLP
jgi:uncharacterized membrane protein YcaP (DUF421 family)